MYASLKVAPRVTLANQRSHEALDISLFVHDGAGCAVGPDESRPLSADMGRRKNRSFQRCLGARDEGEFAVIEPGLYEQLLTEVLRRELDSLDARLNTISRSLRTAEAADRIALHLSRCIQRTLESVGDSDRVQVGIEVARDLIARLAKIVDGEFAETPVEPGTVLHAILERRPDGTPQPIAEPLIPLLDATLLTNAPGEPGLLHQLDAEIESADEIDVLMAFIRRSGINPLMSSLRRHCERGKPLRVLTTIYTGSTERAALQQLTEHGAQVRISYDVSTTRLHAKAWIFQRRSGFSTAYGGSSNLTHSAQVTGLEWNVRASAARNPDILAKFEAVFESYWQSADFVPFDAAEFDGESQRAVDQIGKHGFDNRVLAVISASDNRRSHGPRGVRLDHRRCVRRFPRTRCLRST